MLALFKGAGELASASGRRLRLMGFQVVMTELPQPLCVRRKVAFAECVFTGNTEVDSIRAQRAGSIEQIGQVVTGGDVAVIVSPDDAIGQQLRPAIVVDGRMLKWATSTNLHEAPVVIGLGPGFVAGRDVHAVIETNRGHDLGRAIYRGSPEPNTGVPAPVGWHTTTRVLRAPVAGRFRAFCEIGDHVDAGDPVGSIGDQLLTAPISGVVRGLLYPDVTVGSGTKLGDIDPRDVKEYCFTISDKANSIAGGVVEACLYLLRNRGYSLTWNMEDRSR
jgi:xanthine dehydrogenase accessory factor